MIEVSHNGSGIEWSQTLLSILLLIEIERTIYGCQLLSSCRKFRTISVEKILQIDRTHQLLKRVTKKMKVVRPLPISDGPHRNIYECVRQVMLSVKSNILIRYVVKNIEIRR